VTPQVARAGLVALVVAMAGCAASPEVPPAGSGADAGTVFADVVVSFTSGGTPQVCSDGLPACDGTAIDPCGAAQALGPPDDQAFLLESGGRLDLAFRCAPVTERGGTDSPDVKFWVTVPEGAGAVVEVSDDGTTYEPWIELTESDQDGDLGTIGSMYVRFIRIVDTGEGGIEIDAIEAIR